jgi:F0F1-type ATP synthase beta subunit
VRRGAEGVRVSSPQAAVVLSILRPFIPLDNLSGPLSAIILLHLISTLNTNYAIT